MSKSEPPIKSNEYAQNVKIMDDEDEQSDKKVIVMMLLVGVFVSFLLGIFIYNYLLGINSEEDEEAQSQQQEEGEDEVQAERNTQRIAYMQSGELWIYDTSDGSDTKVQTEENSSVLAYSWKNANELTFAECFVDACEIKTINVIERKKTESYDISAQDVKAVDWSDNGQYLSVLVEREYDHVLSSLVDGSLKDVKKLKVDKNKYLDLNDYVHIEYSPSAKYIMILDTLVQEGAHIVILDKEGVVQTEITEDDATFGFFATDDTFYYKKGDYLFVNSIENGSESKVTERVVNGFNFVPSFDKSSVTYWTYDWTGGVTTIWVYEIGTDEISRLSDNAIFPTWLDENDVVFLTTSYCPRCPLSDFEYSGFSSMDLTTKLTKNLVEDREIESFAI